MHNDTTEEKCLEHPDTYKMEAMLQQGELFTTYPYHSVGAV